MTNTTSTADTRPNGAVSTWRPAAVVTEVEVPAQVDEWDFAELVAPYRRELHAHCYRMLGSVHDTEDVLQETWLRAWRGLASFEQRSSVRTWLYRIATNACLDEIGRRSRRILPVEAVASEPGADEIRWLEPYPVPGQPVGGLGPEARYEQSETVELAFVAALQFLPPSQRAALILRDVLGFSARDAADALETTVTAVNSAVQHARRAVQSRIPELSQQATLRTLTDGEQRLLVRRYMRALEAADLDALIGLLTDDATWSMPPSAEYFAGADAISSFLTSGPFRTQWRHLPTRANGQLAIGCYAWDDSENCYVGLVLDVLTLVGPRIAAVTAFVDRSVFPAFGLPSRLPAR